MPTRLVVVDDASTDLIDYVGNSWFTDTGSQDGAGNFGPPYRSTLHGTKSSASLSFNFTGTSVTVIGTTNIRNDSGVIDPKLECFVDHISIGSTDPFPFPENNWNFCQQDVLVDGPHILTVNVTVARNQTFWFDRIHYTPSPSAALDNKAVYVDSLDPALKYGSGWGALGGSANMTTVKGSTFTYDFTGVSLSWFGFIPQELPGDATTGTYSVDGQPPQSFLLKGHPQDSKTTVYNQKFFETATLPMGTHKLTVVYDGSNQTPLTLDYLVVQNGTSPNINSPATDGGVKKSSTNVGAIAGGIIGALIAIGLGILAFFLLRRRRKENDRQRVKEKRTGPAIDPAVEPFHYIPASQASPDVEPAHAASPNHSTTTWGGSHPVRSPGLSAPYSSAYGGMHVSNPSLGRSEPAMTETSSMVVIPNVGAVPYQPTSSKALEAEAAAVAYRSNRTASHGGSGMGSVDYSTSSSGRLNDVVRHKDSGLRLHTPERHVDEIPPEYTAG